VGPGRTHRPPTSRGVDAVLVLLHNATEAVQKQRELNVKSAIIQEVHHRVKNNLQNIAAILRIQARRVQSDEARQHLTEAVNRVLSMSVIHEFLSQDEHRPINVKDVCQRIAGQVQQVSGNLRAGDHDAGAGPQHPAARQPGDAVAMVVNELLLNAVEHGLSDRARPHPDRAGRPGRRGAHSSSKTTAAACRPTFDPTHRRAVWGCISSTRWSPMISRARCTCSRLAGQRRRWLHRRA
jgi:hypothetical protein